MEKSYRWKYMCYVFSDRPSITFEGMKPITSIFPESFSYKAFHGKRNK